MRTFASGATRDQDDTKPSYRGFTCPLVQRRFGEYMLEHQRQSDGTKRDPDNWKKGIPSLAYLESLLRHVQEIHEQFEHQRPIQEPPHASIDWAPAAIKRYEDTLSAIIFNASGLLRNSLVGRKYEQLHQTGALERKDPCPQMSASDKRFIKDVGALHAQAENMVATIRPLPGVDGVPGMTPLPRLTKSQFDQVSLAYGYGPGEVPPGHMFGLPYLRTTAETEKTCRRCGYPNSPGGPFQPTYGGCGKWSGRQKVNHDFRPKDKEAR